MSRVLQNTLRMKGGFVTDIGVLEAYGGMLAVCQNFEVVTAGYQRSAGYERFDGQPSPSLIPASEEDDIAREAARVLIQAVPGSGSVLGVVKYKGVVYAFRNAVDGLSAKMWKSSVTGWIEVVTGFTLEPSGDYRFIEYNFYGNSDSRMLYGCDGVNNAFQFDGTTFSQIATGNALDTPTHIIGHAFHLFLAFRGGSLQHSVPGDPLDWGGASGAGEIGIGEDIVGLNSLVGGVLQISTDSRIVMLPGSSSLDWQLSNLRAQDDGAGAFDKSIQTINGSAFYLGVNGISSTSATQMFGDFKTGTMSKVVASYINGISRKLICSYKVSKKSQYRLAFNIGAETEILSMSFDRDKIIGFGVSRIPIAISCVHRSSKDMNKEAVYYGSDDGYVYQAETGTSFDGEELLAILRTHFSYQGSPTRRKRYRKLEIAMDASKAVLARIKPLFAFGRPDTAPHLVEDINGVAGGGIWGVDNWGEFTWSSPVTGVVRADIGETATSISINFNTQSKFTESFVINDIVIDYTPRRLNR